MSNEKWQTGRPRKRKIKQTTRQRAIQRSNPPTRKPGRYTADRRTETHRAPTSSARAVENATLQSPLSDLNASPYSSHLANAKALDLNSEHLFGRVHNSP